MKSLTKIGLFFGSFNPIHNGHLAIAEYFHSHTDLQEIWFVVSPQNPLKDHASLLPDSDRLAMTQAAIQEKPYLKVCDAEFHLPKPSYTFDTLTFLSQKYLQNQFVLIIGSDNLAIFEHWKNYREMLDSRQIYVYNRPEFQDVPFKNEANVTFFEAPLLPISSTMIRQKWQQNDNIKSLVPHSVFTYFNDHPNLLK